MLERAYALIEVKSFDEERRTFSGMASTPTMDRQGDIVEPLGVEFSNPLPLLLFHDTRMPVGSAVFHPPTAKGIEFTATIPRIDEPGKLKDRVDEAWQSVKAKLIRGVSIRISARKEGVKPLSSGGLHWLKSKVTELSLVVIPANQEATIAFVKSLDASHAAPGTDDSREPTAPGVSGSNRVVKLATKGISMKKTYAEQITAFESTLKTKTDRMDEIMNVAAEKGETLDAQLKEEHDTLASEVVEINDHIKRLKSSEERVKSTAAPVAGANAEEASKSRGGDSIIRVKDNLPPGIRFARYAMCLAHGKNSRMDALEIAKSAYPDERSIHEAIKAAVVPGMTANNAAPLLQYADWMGDFVEYLRPGTILGKFGQNGVPALRRVPFNVRIMTQTAGGSAYWVGQGKPKPLTKGTYGTITLDFHKLATIAVLTEEEVKFVPSAEAKVRDDLRDAIAAEMDTAFVDPANAGTANVKPASVTNGVVATPVSGTDADAVRVDFKNLMSAFISANVEVNSPVLIMSKQIALNLSLMLNALGQREFPDLTMNGGSLFGVPVITSEYLTSLGSPSTGMVVLINASDIYLADDGAVSVTASGEASLEMLDGSLVQDGSAGTGTSLVSLWQNNLLGLKAERFVTWKKRRSTAAQYLSPVAYTPST